MGKKFVYKKAEIVQKDDVTHLGFGYCGKTTLSLVDYTANGANFLAPHPHYEKYYAKTPYWVQIIDEDDYIGTKTFDNIQDARKFYERFLDFPKDTIEEFEF